MKKIKILEKALNDLIYISSCNDENIFPKILKIFNNAISSNRSSIWIKDERHLKCLSVYPNIEQLQNLQVPFNDPSPCLKKLQSHKPFLLNLENDFEMLCEEFKKYIDRKTTKTILITPIIVNSKIIGIVANSSTKKTDEWNDYEVNFAMVAATILSLHIQTQRVEQISQKLQEMKSLLDNSKTIIFHWSNDEGWPVISVTENIAMFGYSAEDFLNNKITYSSIIYKDDLETVSKEVAYYLEHNIDRFVQVYRIQTANGDIRWIEDTTVVQRDKENKAIGFLGIIHDITEKREIENRLKENEAKFKAMVESSLAGVFVYRDTYLYINSAFEEITGYSENQLKKMMPESVLEKKLQKSFHEIGQKRIQGKLLAPSAYQDIPIIRKDGQKRIIRLSASTILYEGNYAGAGTVVDVTDIVREKKQRMMLSQTLKQTDDIVYITKIDGSIIYVNESTIKNYGYTKEELLGSSPQIFASGKYDKSFFKKLWEIILSGKNYNAVLTNRTKDGKLLYEEKNITPILNENNEIESFVSTGTNITKRVELEKKLKKMAIIDNLTQVYNRHKLNEIIQAEIEMVKRYEENSAIVMIDIDHFKYVNDTYGHDIGDVVLKFLCQTILHSIRKVDTFGRWGGEEFILILSHLDISQALIKAESIRKTIENSLIDGKYKITISMGVTKFKNEDTMTQLLKRVDDLLYEAKETGRNKVVAKV
ncbi:diguanylate cyclase/phosphodiesterase (GGDEF & EAL domains) with PAS/PAC sensor(s) [hydrothermal vent metagenome]|uniref:Diguanylate cyclase/phosphodiesterase (GGDEF & EAL domains) with PAS/PAC sensor(S) n=1 Tax=hydrothermal vent metagenome TaxID=652676 RepID=A0A1W1C0R1_9ZZZZ